MPNRTVTLHTLLRCQPSLQVVRPFSNLTINPILHHNSMDCRLVCGPVPSLCRVAGGCTDWRGRVPATCLWQAYRSKVRQSGGLLHRLGACWKCQTPCHGWTQEFPQVGSPLNASARLPCCFSFPSQLPTTIALSIPPQPLYQCVTPERRRCLSYQPEPA